MCSLKVRKYHRKKTVLESVFEEVAGLRVCDFITKKLQQRCFPVKFAKSLRTSFLTQHLQWLLLYHCEIHLYRLRIFLKIQLNFALFLKFFSSLIPSFFFTPSKKTQNHQTNFRYFLLPCIYIYSYLHFLIYI